MMSFRNGRAEGNINGAVLAGSAASVAEAARPEDAPTAAPPLPPGRAALSDAIASFYAARAELEAASQPVRRLQEIITELDHAERDLEIIDREHERVVGAWLASGSPGEKPLPPAHRVGLAQRRDGLLPDSVAAETALPAARELEQRAAETAAAASCRLREAIAAAARDAAAELYPLLRACLEEFLATEAPLRSLEMALRTVGNKNDSTGYLVAANQISDAIADIKRHTGTPINVAAGERLLSALATNAQAVLE